MSSYRPDIDGLRAVAVLAVLAFHALPAHVAGGFIGVDVFFVISGFLISGILFAALEAGTFSFRDFYARRIRRIFPALLLVLAAALLLGHFVLLPDEFRALGKHVAASAGFMQNFALWKEAGYFDAAAETKPLLHLWSLGVEEQFYLAWPLLLWLGWKTRIPLWIPILALLGLSFAINVWTVRHDWVAAFYLPQTRFWELLAGAGLAWVALHRPRWLPARVMPATDASQRQQSPAARLVPDAMAVVGLLLLAYGFLTYDAGMKFPDGWAWLPVGATVLLIAAGPYALPNRFLLASKPMVWIGLISYPLYLWHWLLLSLARIVESATPSLGIRLGSLAASFVLAALTYWLLERPLRFGRHRGVKAIALLVAMVVVGVMGFRIWKAPPAASEPQSLVDQRLGEAVARCTPVFKPEPNGLDCKMQRAAGQNTVAIIGDSHAGGFYRVLSEAMPENQGLVALSASCAIPMLNVSTGTKSPSAGESRKNNWQLINHAFDYILSRPEIRTVYLANSPLCTWNDAIDTTDRANPDHRDVLEKGMRRTFDALLKAGKRVVLIEDNPNLPFDPKACVARPFRITQREDQCAFPRVDFEKSPFEADFRGVTRKVMKDYPQVASVDLAAMLCDAQRCNLQQRGQVLYRDTSHLNDDGMRLAIPDLLRAGGIERK